MRNKSLAKKLQILFIVVITAAILVSCANLPQKIEEPKDTDSETVTVNINDNSDDVTDFNMIQNPGNSAYEWVPPAEGPTVTAIVLGIEKRGEEGGIIIRTPYPDTGALNYSSEQTVSIVPTAVPSIGNGGMYDQMDVVSYNPTNSAVFLPSQAFHLDVTLKNSGTTTWQTSYRVTDISGSPITVQREYNLPYAVAPGGTVVLSIYMSTPSEQGVYQETFQIQDAYGVVFGRFEYSLNVGDFSYVTAIPTLTPTITPTYYSAEGITATPDSLAWMCVDPERSKLQDCYSFCVEYSHLPEFYFCFYDGQRYETPVPEYNGG